MRSLWMASLAIMLMVGYTGQALAEPIGRPAFQTLWQRTGIPIQRDVMFQAFERRVLTYVPDNPAQYQVEMGNVGRHYYNWRYVQPFADGAQAIITLPDQGAVVGSPLTVRGFENGTAFEAGITVRLRNQADDQVLATSSTSVIRPDIGIPGPFTTTLTFTPPPQNTTATLEVLIFAPRDGAELVLARRDVVIGP